VLTASVRTVADSRVLLHVGVVLVRRATEQRRATGATARFERSALRAGPLCGVSLSARGVRGDGRVLGLLVNSETRHFFVNSDTRQADTGGANNQISEKLCVGDL
jgi:hypothetical protein